MPTKHTPGPWEFYEPNTGRIFHATFGLLDSNGRSLGVDVDATENTRPMEENIANARLIASAPELLDAIKDAAEIISCHINSNCSKADSIDKETIERCLDIISKAEGKD